MHTRIEKSDVMGEPDTLVVEMTIRFYADASAYTGEEVKSHVEELLHRRCMFDVDVDPTQRQ